MSQTRVPQWKLFETEFSTSTRFDNPFLDVDVSVRFETDEITHRVDAFYDGEEDGSSVWRVRFAPMEQGAWRYETSSDHPDLDGITGEFVCDEPENRGGLTVDRQFPNWFFRDDGRAEFVLNDGWTPHPGSTYGIEEHGPQKFGYPSEDEFQTFVDVLSSHDVNMFVDLRQLYARQKTCTDPSYLWPWKVVDPETHQIDRDRFSLEYFQRLDRQIAYAATHGVFYGVEVLYDNSTFRKQEWANHPYNERNGGWIEDWDAPTDEYTTDQLPFGWGIRRILDLDDETHMSYLKRYVSYLTARTAAYWNVFYAMGCETSNLYPGYADMVDRWFEWWGDYVARIDPHGRLLTIGDVGSRRDVEWHELRDDSAFVYDNARNDLITTQEHTFTDDLNDYCDAIHKFGLRFWEFRRPTVIGEQDGRNNDKYSKERRGYWTAFVSGFTFGRIDRHYAMADGDRLRESTLFGYDGDPPIYTYLEHLATFVEDGDVSFWRMTPSDSLLEDASRSVYCLAEEEREYVLYFATGGDATLSLPAGRYAARWFDPREGRFTAEEQIESGERAFEAPDDRDWALHVRTVS